MDRIEEIRQRAEAATPGAWKTVTHEEYSTVDVDEQGGENIAMVGSAIADADFIANAREDIPHLLSEVDRLGRDINVLTARAEAAEAERDAAVKDLKRFSACCQCNANIDGSCCDMFDGTAENKYFCSNWQWRGQQAGKGDAPNE